MPIQIVNSGVNLASEPNTSTTVVFRDEGGVVCRLSNNPYGHRKIKNFSRRGSIMDASDGSTAMSASDRHTPLAAAHPNDGEGVNSSSPSNDMTSVFGLKVLRLNAEELAAEEQTKGKNKGSAVQASAQPETDGGKDLENDESDASARSGGAEEGGADTLPAEAWMTRTAARMQKKLPAHTTLAERVRRGNDLVKAVRAGRSFRKATVSSIKGALELGLWAANRPDEFVKRHQAFKHHVGKPPPGKATNSQGPPGRMSIKAHGSGERGGADGASNSPAQIGPASGGDFGGGGVRGHDRVRILEAKLRDMEDKLARAPRKPIGGGGDGSRQARQRRSSSIGSTSSPGVSRRSAKISTAAPALHTSHGGAGPGIREGGAPSPATTTGALPRLTGVGGAAAAAATTTDGRAGAKPQRPPSDQDGGVGFPGEGLEQGTTRAVAVAGEGRAGASRHHSPPGGSHTARSAPATTGRGRSHRPHGHQSAMASGSMSARRAAQGAAAPSVELSAAAQKELIAVMKAYLLRQVSLDNALSESMTRRDFDWDINMRRMMNSVKIAAAGEGKRTFESVTKVMRRQMAAKRRLEEARSLQASWFPSVMKRVLVMVQGKEGGEMPRCMTKLAAALHKVLVGGHTVTPYVFWSLVDASFLPEDHERPSAQKMILACLSSVHQRPENYHRFLVDNGIKVSPSLKQGFQRAHQKRAAHRKGTSRKSQLVGGSLNRLAGVVEGAGDHHHAGGMDDRRSSNMSTAVAGGGGMRHGGGGASTANLSDGGGSDDMSDTMSVFSVSTLLEGGY